MAVRATGHYGNKQYVVSQKTQSEGQKNLNIRFAEGRTRCNTHDKSQPAKNPFTVSRSPGSEQRCVVHTVWIWTKSFEKDNRKIKIPQVGPNAATATTVGRSHYWLPPPPDATIVPPLQISPQMKRRPHPLPQTAIANSTTIPLQAISMWWRTLPRGGGRRHGGERCCCGKETHCRHHHHNVEAPLPPSPPPSCQRGGRGRVGREVEDVSEDR